MKYDLAKIHRGSEAVHDHVSVPNMAKDAFDKRRDARAHGEKDYIIGQPFYLI